MNPPHQPTTRQALPVSNGANSKLDANKSVEIYDCQTLVWLRVNRPIWKQEEGERLF